MREIERSLRARLKAHRLSDSFIERCAEEAVQRAWLDYLRAVGEGTEVGNRGAFLANAAFCRAIDELRHESHEARGVQVDGLLASGRFAAPAAEEVAVERLAAQELHTAIETMPDEERQILTLHYFEALSDRQASEVLYCSESTFRRRRQRALRRLGLLLGLPAPEPGSDLAIEIGLAAWVGLRGGRVAVSGGALGRLASLADGAREAAAGLLERARDLAASLTASGTGERLGTLAGGQAARVFAGCAGAAAVCVAGGVIVAGGGGIAAHRPPARPHARAEARSTTPSPHPTEPIAVPARPDPQATSAASPSPPANRKQRIRLTREAEQRQVEAQTSGIARAGAEAPPATGAESATAPAGETVTVPSPSAGSSSQAASEEEQAERQFGAFK